MNLLQQVYTMTVHSENSDENEISLYYHYLIKHSNDENKESDHQG